ncbi:MAG: DNA cytosine methyltransferase [Candidatus Heimdallarchaeaceae archaeon]
MQKQTKTFTFIDLFSGAGGFSSGFIQEGFHDLLAIEQNPTAAETYRINSPNSIIINKDIKDIHSLEIESLIKQKTDVVLASPPCEPFTLANPKRRESSWKRFYEDPQGDLIFHAIRIIGDLQPRFFVIENVVPMIEEEGREIIEKELEKVGYDEVYFNIIRAEQHGCPSARRRVFIANLSLELPKENIVTAGEVLKDLPNPAYPNDLPNHFLTSIPESVEKKIHKINQGQAAIYFRGAQTEKMNWIRIDPDKIANTVMGKARFIHPEENRPLTVREHARLMTFPDEFKFTGATYEMYNQVGEAVPPLISRLIAKRIKEILIHI